MAWCCNEISLERVCRSHVQLGLRCASSVLGFRLNRVGIVGGRNEVDMKMKWLVFLFIAKVTIPWGGKYTYNDVARVVVEATNYKLILADGKMVLVPTMFTVIEEQ